MKNYLYTNPIGSIFPGQIRSPNFTSYQDLSTQSFSVNWPELWLTLPNEPTDDRPLKLLLPSLKCRDFLDFLSFEEEYMSSSSTSGFSLTFATANRAMVVRQNGHMGGVRQAVVGLGLLWQHKARVQWAHIWWPQSWTSIVQIWSKQMQHNSVSLAF